MKPVASGGKPILPARAIRGSYELSDFGAEVGRTRATASGAGARDTRRPDPGDQRLLLAASSGRVRQPPDWGVKENVIERFAGAGVSDEKIYSGDQCGAVHRAQVSGSGSTKWHTRVPSHEGEVVNRFHSCDRLQGLWEKGRFCSMSRPSSTTLAMLPRAAPAPARSDNRRTHRPLTIRPKTARASARMSSAALNRRAYFVSVIATVTSKRDRPIASARRTRRP